jgi:maleamate amidohydrolase
MRRSYGTGTVGFGEQPAIIVVDFQKGFTDPQFPLGGAPLVTRALENTMELLRAARDRKVPVVASSTAYRSTREMPYWKIAAVRENFLIGDPNTEFDTRTYNPDYDLAVLKSAPSVFFNTIVQSYFSKLRVDTVIIAGCNTSGCIRATTIDSFSFCYRTIIPEECVGDVDEGPHRESLRDLDRRYADVTTLQHVIDQLKVWPANRLSDS